MYFCNESSHGWFYGSVLFLNRSVQHWSQINLHVTFKKWNNGCHCAKNKFLASLRNNSLSDVQAIADLVDNSLDLDVDASRIEITKHDDVLTIADNGSGMTLDVLVDAMKLGSSGKDDPTDTDLGLFGIGLKNSSLAMGRRLL